MRKKKKKKKIKTKIKKKKKKKMKKKNKKKKEIKETMINQNQDTCRQGRIDRQIDRPTNQQTDTVAYSGLHATKTKKQFDAKTCMCV